MRDEAVAERPVLRVGRWARADWERVIIVASGPSLKLDNYAQAKRIVHARQRSDAFRVIVVNDNWKWIPNADLLYAGDGTYWERAYADVVRSQFAGERWTQDAQSAERYGLHYVRQARRPGLTRTPGLIYGAGNSGHQAIQLAYLLGASDIALVAYDMMPDPETGEQHHFGEHPRRKVKGSPTGALEAVPQLPFWLWIDALHDIAPPLRDAGVRVRNASPRSAVNCFERQGLAEILHEWIGL